jgi:hypothetical protein
MMMFCGLIIYEKMFFAKFTHMILSFGWIMEEFYAPKLTSIEVVKQLMCGRWICLFGKNEKD